MKKLLSLLSIVALVFVSCSKDNDNDKTLEPSPDPLLLVKNTTVIDSTGNSSTENYLYDENKILSITKQDSSVFRYTYTGDFITKMERINKHGDLDTTTSYSYIDGKMESSSDNDKDSDVYFKTKYTHNEDGTVTFVQYRGSIETGAERKFGATGKYTFIDGNLVKFEVTNYGLKTLYEYDIKKNPSKNILGFNLLLDLQSLKNVSVNNIIKETATDPNLTTTEKNFMYKYDENGYPIEKTLNFPGTSDIEITQFVY